MLPHPLLAAAALTIQQPPAPPPAEFKLRPSESLHFEFQPGVWFPRMDGETTFGTIGASTLDLDLDLGLAGQDASPRGEMAVSWQEWVVRASGFDFSTDGTRTLPAGAIFGDVAVPAGGEARTSIDLMSFGAEASWALARPATDRVWPWGEREYNQRNVNSDGDYLADLRLGLAAAIRYLDLEHTFERVTTTFGPSQAHVEAEWITILGGVDLEFTIRPGDHFPFVDSFSLHGAGLFGPALGGDGGTSFEARAGVLLHVTPNIGAMFGWRGLWVDLDDGDYNLDGTLQGIFAAASIAF